ncbi:DUF3857 domain-containing protein [Flavobacterium sp. MAH-1]|uniref:DUF3857 domain-containing protein n=1 Tax=Flavobacterium agri TaxID=2743471 RepID=A0A7Y9C6S4_9FLAO|nr:DUF3857 domain-containing protein [Flavobacterium agri]NUY82593.1 DUF3857 domain-containing protein [Flavobacterium agri]NYA72616.1 DUF3857 domain-containing protein [Flavobacterium agri]
MRFSDSFTKRFYAIVFFLGASIAIAQKRPELGHVTVAELEQKKHPKDSSAAAAYLYKHTKVTFSFDAGGIKVITDTEAKIKVYGKDGYDYATYEDFYYVRGGSISVKEAATYNLVNGKVEKTKLKGESEFESKVTKQIRSKKFVLPNVREGSILEYRIVKTTYSIGRLRDFYFQNDIPVDYVQYELRLPSDFKYSKLIRGSLNPEIREETITEAYGSQVQKTTYTLKDVAAMKEEEYVTNIDNFRSHIECELSGYTDSYNILHRFSTDWASVGGHVFEDEDFGPELKRTNYFEEDIKPLVDGKTDIEKMNILFNYVQSRMVWNKYMGYSCDDGVRAAYKNKIGNIAEINLMLTSMLRHSGLKADPILLSTRENGIYSFPSLTAFDYVICGVKIGEELHLLDASDKHAQPNILPVRAINDKGRLFNEKEGSYTVSLEPEKFSRKMVTVLATLTPDGQIDGQARDNYFEHHALRYRDSYADLGKELCADKTEKRFSGLEISDYDVLNRDNLAKPVTESYTFHHSGLADLIGDKIYFSPMLFLSLAKSPFTQDKREYPVDFVFPYQDKYVISIKIPDGYEVESVPKEAKLGMQDNLGTFFYSIAPQQKTLQLTVQYNINKAVISEEYYEILKEFFSQMIAKQNEKVILKKV